MIEIMSYDNFRVDKSVFSVLVGLLFVGLVTMGSVGATAVYYVNNADPTCDTGGDTLFCTIQEALDEAPSGATVNVASGTYSARIKIEKSVSLIGSGIGLSIIDATSFDTAGNVIEITAKSGNTIIQGFDILTGDHSNGIYSSGGTDGSGSIEIKDNHLISTYYGDDQFGIIAGYGDVRHLIISGNTISNTYSNSILVELQKGETEIKGNTLEGGFPSIFFMTYDGNDVATLQNISGNTIDMSAAEPLSGVAGIGINPSTYYVTADRRTGKYENFEISNNVITGVETDTSIKGISIGENSVDGVSGGFTNLVITGNTVSGTSGKGIQLFGHITGADVHDNIISGLYQGIKGFTYASSFYPENNNIYHNQITGATDKLVYWTGSTSFDLENNWWGSDDDIIVTPLISGNVDYLPFCLDSTCATFGNGISPSLIGEAFVYSVGPGVPASMDGSVATGFYLPTDGTSTERKIQFDGTTSSEPLAPLKFGLVLIAKTVSDSTLEAYYSAYPEPYKSYLINAAHGTGNFAYVYGSTGNSVKLADAARFDNPPNTAQDMAVPGNYPEGVYTVSGQITDVVGNPTTVTYNLIIDRTAPVISVPSDITQEANGPLGSTVDFIVTANDNIDGSLVPVCTPASGSTFGIATTVVSCTSTDAAGNTGTASFNVRVRDTTRPVISGMPSDIITEATGPDGAIVTWISPTATDIVDITVPVICTPASGSLIGLGGQTVSCTATDSHGQAKSLTFSILVQDTTPPSLTVTSPANTAYSSVDVSLEFAAIDSSSGLNSCWYVLDDSPNSTIASCTNTVLSGLSESAHKIVVYAKDNWNNLVQTLPISFVVKVSGPAPRVVNDTNVTVNSSNTDIVVPFGQNISNVTVTSDVPDDVPVTLDLSLNAFNDSTTNEKIVTLNNNLTLTRDALIDYQVDIPSGTNLSGPLSWNGVINVPTVTTSNVTLPTPEGWVPSEVHAVEVGYSDVQLNFSQPVRLLIVGQAGKYAGYTRNGVFHVISDCTAGYDGSTTIADSCKMDSGFDLVIWTMHFTQFVSYWRTNPPVSPGNAVASSTCTPNWQCNAWNACIAAGTQTRTCTDLNSCSSVSSAASKPSETQACVYAAASTPSVNYCGDGACGVGETCSNCADDCGPCAQEQPQPPAQPSTPEATGPSVTGAAVSVSGAGAGASSSLAGLVVLAVIAGLVIYAFVIRPGRSAKKGKATQSSTLPA
jgi:hypothetical protein